MINEAQPLFADLHWRRAALQTPFEKNILPAFARWFLQLLEEEQPDVIMPIETKGARLLDATLDYLRDELGAPVRAKVRYRRSLDYTDPETLAGKKVLILDDATRTGRSLNRYRLRVRDCSSEAKVVLAACFGALTDDGKTSQRVHQDIRCFLDCTPDRYHENLWQLTELVVARGLPPEVDHHIFTAMSFVPLIRHWTEVTRRLGEYGDLEDHGIVSADGLVVGATLHEPSFAPGSLLPANGQVRREGVVKVRVFGDLARNELIIVPLAYVEVEVDSEKGKPFLTAGEARSLYDAWCDDCSPVGSVLFDHTYPTSKLADVLFTAACLTIEVELVSGVVTVLADVGGDNVGCDTSHFFGLYGEAAPALIESVTREIGSGNRPSAVDHVAGGNGQARSPHSARRLRASTEDVVRYLKRGYFELNRGRPFRDWVSFSRSYSDLGGVLAQPDNGDLNLLSRVLDFGLSVGSLVPATEAVEVGNKVRLRRQYRTSEQTAVENDDDVLDLQWYGEEIATETVGVVLRFLMNRSERWRARPVPPTVVNKILAILDTAMPEMRQTAVAIAPGQHGPEAFVRLSRYLGPDELKRLMNLPTADYEVVDGALQPTPAFETRYKSGDLQVNRRRLLPLIETYLDKLVPVLDDAQDVSALLVCWGMSSAAKLGLEYVMHDVDLALREVDAPIAVLRGGRELDRRKLDATCKEAKQKVAFARSEKLVELESDWSRQIIEQWRDPISVEQSLLASVNAPESGAVLFDLARGFCDVVDVFINAVATLAALAPVDPQASLFAEPDVEPDDVTRDLMQLLNLWRTRLQTMREPTSAEPAGDPDKERIGRALRRFGRLLRRYASAYAWRYDGVVGSEFGARARTGETRSRVLLYADLAGSTPRGLDSEHRTYASWVNAGLNLIAQWALAFGAREVLDPGSRGDDICLEFLDADSAVLCACVAEEHLTTLRSIDNPALVYEVHWGIDQDLVTEADAGKRYSAGIARAAKLAKRVDVREVGLTPDVRNDCSPALKASLSASTEEIDLGSADPRGHFRPYLADRESVLRAYVERLRSPA